MPLIAPDCPSPQVNAAAEPTKGGQPSWAKKGQEGPGIKKQDSKLGGPKGAGIGVDGELAAKLMRRQETGGKTDLVDGATRAMAQGIRQRQPSFKKQGTRKLEAEGAARKASAEAPRKASADAPKAPVKGNVSNRAAMFGGGK